MFRRLKQSSKLKLKRVEKTSYRNLKVYGIPSGLPRTINFSIARGAVCPDVGGGVGVEGGSVPWDTLTSRVRDYREGVR